MSGRKQDPNPMNPMSSHRSGVCKERALGENISNPGHSRYLTHASRRFRLHLPSPLCICASIYPTQYSSGWRSPICQWSRIRKDNQRPLQLPPSSIMHSILVYYNRSQGRKEDAQTRSQNEWLAKHACHTGRCKDERETQIKDEVNPSFR